MKRRKRVSRSDFTLLFLIIIVAVPVALYQWVQALPPQRKLLLGAAVLTPAAIMLSLAWLRWRKRRRRRRLYRRMLAEFRWNEAMSPDDFERCCADYLTLKGWRSRRTGGSGDQGIDVLAEKDDIRLVLQCKKYGKPVGNRAVQEAFAAKAHAHATAAAVVSTQGFTRSAHELAATTGVLLLHFTELRTIDERLSGENPLS
jgi:HJR/Mrr/RecB family endonuclease